MKLQLIYSPEDGPERTWELDPQTILSVEAEMLEDCGGDVWRNYGDFWGYVQDGNIRSWRALLWLMLHRENPKLRFQDVVFKVNEFGVDIPADEAEPVGKDGPDDTATGSPSATQDSPVDSESSTDGQSQSSTQPVPG